MDRKIKFDITIKSVVAVVAVLVLFALLFYVKDILVLFLIAFIIATALEPAVDWLEKKHIPRAITMTGLFIIIGLLFYTLVRLMIPPITDQVNNLVSSRQVIVERINSYLSHAPVSIKTGLLDFVNVLPDKLTGLSSGSFVTSVFGVVTGLFAVLTVLVTIFYLLMEKNIMEKAIRFFWPISSEERALLVFKKIVEKISSWARGQIVLSTSVGVLTFIGLSILRFEYALVIALVAAFMDLIPFIGPTITMVLGVALAFAYSPMYALWVAILFLGIQQFEAHVLVPQIMKRAVGISPVITIFAIVIGAKLLGLIGVIIAVPIASIIIVILEELNKKGKK